jgi:3-oxoacyl-[acyl-carrier protein] reductase
MAIKSILITGSSRGLGLALVEHYVNLGYQVYGCSRNENLFKSDNYEHFCLDVGDEAGVVEMFRKISANKIPLEILINNAGLSQSSLGVLTSGKIANQIIQTNLIGAFFVAREAIKIMMRYKYGRVINFSSINIPQRSSGSAIYNASKAGLAAFSDVLARECSAQDITFNTIVLSIVANSGMADSLDQKSIKVKQAGLLKPGFLTKNEIIHAIDFFASPLAKNITCQTLNFGGV